MVILYVHYVAITCGMSNTSTTKPGEQLQYPSQAMHRIIWFFVTLCLQPSSVDVLFMCGATIDIDVMALTHTALANEKLAGEVPLDHPRERDLQKPKDRRLSRRWVNQQVALESIESSRSVRHEVVQHAGIGKGEVAVPCGHRSRLLWQVPGRSHASLGPSGCWSQYQTLAPPYWTVQL